ncbi:MAG: hypothetical protein IT443_08790 [Phycisphaeraceae bacterium]|nr:hypothetical protein [Phycisphaeraceae bacterium]
MAASSSPPSPARWAAAEALARAAQVFPRLGSDSPIVTRLSPVDASLALAIYRTVMQRWLTLGYLLDRYLEKPLHRLEPRLQGIFLAAAAQILFFDRTPTHAIVDDAVELAKRHVRAGAGPIVNAVLRRLSELVKESLPDQPWLPQSDRLPLENGSILLTQSILPPVDQPELFLSVATSHPRTLISRWLNKYNFEKATSLALCGLRHPPTIVALECPAAQLPADAPAADGSPRWLAHQRPGFILWQSTQDELRPFLSAHPVRRVQDPSATLAVASVADLKPKRILDACAGRGTKTRQLAAQFPSAQIFATDLDTRRVADMNQALPDLPNVQVCPMDRILKASQPADAMDLILLDVPCTNTAVLSRRPEARYRFQPPNLKSLLATQRQILLRFMPLLAKAGSLVYSTCSLVEDENQDLIRAITRQTPLSFQREHLELPAGTADSYHDGSYHAVLKKN